MSLLGRLVKGGANRLTPVREKVAREEYKRLEKKEYRAAARKAYFERRNKPKVLGGMY